MAEQGKATCQAGFPIKNGAGHSTNHSPQSRLHEKSSDPIGGVETTPIRIRRSLWKTDRCRSSIVLRDVSITQNGG